MIDTHGALANTAPKNTPFDTDVYFSCNHWFGRKNSFTHWMKKSINSPYTRWNNYVISQSSFCWSTCKNSLSLRGFWRRQDRALEIYQLYLPPCKSLLRPVNDAIALFFFHPNVAISTESTRCHWLILTLASEVYFIHSELSIKFSHVIREESARAGPAKACPAKTLNGAE